MTRGRMRTMRTIFTGPMINLDAAQETLGNAKRDWIKNNRVHKKIKKAMQCIVEAREIAIAEIQREQGIQIRLD
jgi:hypothetical protein